MENKDFNFHSCGGFIKTNKELDEFKEEDLHRYKKVSEDILGITFRLDKLENLHEQNKLEIKSLQKESSTQIEELKELFKEVKEQFIEIKNSAKIVKYSIITLVLGYLAGIFGITEVLKGLLLN